MLNISCRFCFLYLGKGILDNENDNREIYNEWLDAWLLFEYGIEDVVWE